MNLLSLTFLFPLIGFILLAVFRDRLSENIAATIGVGSLGLSALTALLAGQDFLAHIPAGQSFHQELWHWLTIGHFSPAFGLHLDGLSLTLLGVITGVGFFIHLFASWYMRGDPGYARFFSYMNLFVASMILLVLGDNLMLLYLGWEGVGICSYLLIGFYFHDRANGRAAIKAFTVTRVGDVFLAIGLFMLFREMGTLDIHKLVVQAPQFLVSGSTTANWIALMLLGGAVGKSAQIPLQTWLADAMAGPTPVSALIHAATMVTAGVYLIARMHTVFEAAPAVLELVGAIGATTLVIAGFSALVQTDIKRVLAYSTMSQIGYMFLALGAGAWQAAVFHLMTHAFFKALLFLSAGAVIVACHHEQNIFKMGGLRKKIPFVYACFIVGGAALAALPLVTAGYYSKDEILWEAWASGHQGLFWAGLLGAFLTSMYTFRLIWLVFHGEEKTEAHALHGVSYWVPLGVLLVLSTMVGGMIHPPLEGVLPEGAGAILELKHQADDLSFVQMVAGGTAIAGVLAGAALYVGKRRFITQLRHSRLGDTVAYWWYNAFGFDALYDLIFVKPFLGIARMLGNDPIDRMLGVVPGIVRGFNGVLTRTETGSLRGYAAGMALGIVFIVLALVALQVLGK